MGFTGFTVVMPFLPLYVAELGVTDPGDIALWSGAALGVTPAIAAACSPFWGRIGDRFGNKLLVQRSLVAAVCVMSAMAFATRAWHLVALRTVMGLFAGWGPLTISMAALAAPPDRVAQAIGTIQTAQRMGPTLGPVIGGVLAPVFGLRNAFLVSAGFYVITFVWVTLLYKEDPQRRVEAASEAASEAAAAPRKERSFATILAFENLLLLMVVIFGVQLVDRSFAPVLALHLSALGYGAEQVALTAGIMFSVLAISAASGNQLAGFLLHRLTPRQVIAQGTLVAAAALTMLAFTSSLWLMAFELALIGAGSGATMTTTFAAGAAVIPRESHNTAFGFLTGASLVAVAVSPVLSGLVAAQSIRIVFVGGVAVLVTLAIVVRKLMVERTAAAGTPQVSED